MPKKSLANDLLKVILDKALSSGLIHFKKLKASENYSLKEKK